MVVWPSRRCARAWRYGIMDALKRSVAWSEYVGSCTPLRRIASTTIRAPQGGIVMPRGVYLHKATGITHLSERPCTQCGKVFVARVKDRPNRGKFCSRRCVNRSRMVPIHDRFWEKVNKDGPIPEYRPDLGPCWLWTGSNNNRGYGQIFGEIIEGHTKMKFAHIVSYKETNGEVPAGLEIDHLCRVRHCVNPAHLEAVTRSTNVRRGIGPTASYAIRRAP